MAFAAEAIYVLLEGGSVLVITDVTDEKTAADVVIYDGETYRDDFVGGEPPASAADYPGLVRLGGPFTNAPTGALSDAILDNSGTNTYTSLSDAIAHIPPRYKGKQRTLWSFPRNGKFTHVVWADLVQGTSAKAPYRLGMTPTSLT